jgi:acetyl-CoA carboxylase biotin carboxyl carrier protein
VNLSHLKELVRIVEASDIDEIEISRWGQKIRVTKNRRENHAARVDAASAGNGAGTAAAATARDAAPAALTPPPAAAPAPARNEAVLKAPMVGTVYRASSPDARPFVEVGDPVQPGTVVCIIEAMKLMNEIQSEVAGRITSIELENAQPVEFGQVLFRIAPA